jgi:glucose-specific phosphotransferase system IIA component
MLGDGMAIEPASEQILAPFDGTVVAVFPTGHAIGLRSLAGLECLIHIGIDTVTLNGQGFRLLVKQEQAVRHGTPLINLDLAVLRSTGKDLVTPIVITNSDSWQVAQRWEKPTIESGTDILFVARCANKP